MTIESSDPTGGAVSASRVRPASDRQPLSIRFVLRKAAIGVGFVLLGMACFTWGVVMPFLGLAYTVQLLT